MFINSPPDCALNYLSTHSCPHIKGLCDLLLYIQIYSYKICDAKDKQLYIQIHIFGMSCPVIQVGSCPSQPFTPRLLSYSNGDFGPNHCRLPDKTAFIQGFLDEVQYFWCFPLLVNAIFCDHQTHVHVTLHCPKATHCRPHYVQSTVWHTGLEYLEQNISELEFLFVGFIRLVILQEVSDDCFCDTVHWVVPRRRTCTSFITALEDSTEWLPLDFLLLEELGRESACLLRF